MLSDAPIRSSERDEPQGRRRQRRTGGKEGREALKEGHFGMGKAKYSVGKYIKVDIKMTDIIGRNPYNNTSTQRFNPIHEGEIPVKVHLPPLCQTQTVELLVCILHLGHYIKFIWKADTLPACL